MQKKQKNSVIPYPRSCAFAWNNRGQLVTFSYYKYDFSKLSKTKNNNNFENQNSSKAKDRHQKSFSAKEIPGADYDFKSFFQYGQYFKGNHQGYGGRGYGLGGSINDGGRTMLGHGENGTVIDDFAETTNRDFQSQSFFFRDDGLMMGLNPNATNRTIGEETSNQVPNHLNTNTSGHGNSNRNNQRAQNNNPF